MGRRRSGRANPETVSGFVFRLASPLRQAVLAREDGSVSVFQLGSPLAPGRARTKSIGYIRLDPDDPR